MARAQWPPSKRQWRNYNNKLRALILDMTEQAANAEDEEKRWPDMIDDGSPFSQYYAQLVQALTFGDDETRGR